MHSAGKTCLAMNENEDNLTNEIYLIYDRISP